MLRSRRNIPRRNSRFLCGMPGLESSENLERAASRGQGQQARLWPPYPTAPRSELLRRLDQALADLLGGGGVTPLRRVLAVAPGTRAVEGVHAELLELVHLADPTRMHPIGVVVR